MSAMHVNKWRSLLKLCECWTSTSAKGCIRIKSNHEYSNRKQATAWFCCPVLLSNFRCHGNERRERGRRREGEAGPTHNLSTTSSQTAEIIENRIQLKLPLIYIFLRAFHSEFNLFSRGTSKELWVNIVHGVLIVGPNVKKRDDGTQKNSQQTRDKLPTNSKV